MDIYDLLAFKHYCYIFPICYTFKFILYKLMISTYLPVNMNLNKNLQVLLVTFRFAKFCKTL